MRETPRTEACPARPTDATTITTRQNSVNAPGYQLTIHSRLGEYDVGAISYLLAGAGTKQAYEIDRNLSRYYDWSSTSTVIRTSTEPGIRESVRLSRCELRDHPA